MVSKVVPFLKIQKIYCIEFWNFHIYDWLNSGVTIGQKMWLKFTLLKLFSKISHHPLSLTKLVTKCNYFLVVTKEWSQNSVLLVVQICSFWLASIGTSLVWRASQITNSFPITGVIKVWSYSLNSSSRAWISYTSLMLRVLRLGQSAWKYP